MLRMDTSHELNRFARGEGGVVIVIKPLKDALKSGDHIYATILGSSINVTGSAAPLYVPHGPTQQLCFQKAASRAGISVYDVDYLEMHCTGTSVGDPIEVNAAANLLHRGSQVPIGSVKGNIGWVSFMSHRR
jgi:acyl transferase domain-containing protein